MRIRTTGLIIVEKELESHLLFSAHAATDDVGDYEDGQLSDAAAYLLISRIPFTERENIRWRLNENPPSAGGRVERLAKAAVLLIREIDRLRADGRPAAPAPAAGGE